jgi:uncharacterized membrane protein YdjX (TVP38/TMEM64 family)
MMDRRREPERRARRRGRRRLLFFAVALCVALVSIFFVRESIRVEWTAESVRTLVEQAGYWGPLIFLLMMTFRFAVLIPSPVLLTASGICFGVVAGTIYGGLGLLLSALLKFAIANLAGRESLIARLPESARRRLTVVNSGVGIGVLGAASSSPFGPAGVIHIGAILSGMRIAPFALAVGVGSLIRAGTFSYFGNALSRGDGLAIAAGILAAAAVAPLLVPAWRGWFLAQVRAPRP